METTKDRRGNAGSSQSRQQAQLAQQDPMQLTEDVIRYLQDYARQKPEVAAGWCLAIGFFLGWKLKPW